MQVANSMMCEGNGCKVQEVQDERGKCKVVSKLWDSFCNLLKLDIKIDLPTVDYNNPIPIQAHVANSIFY